MKKLWKKFKTKIKNMSKLELFLAGIMLMLVFLFAIVVGFFTYVIISAPNFDPEALYKQEASIIYDKHGNEIKKLGVEKRKNVTYDELPEVFIDALVATEDARFFTHSGVDIGRFMKATIEQILGKSGAGGASTLTMQVAKLNFTSSEASGIKGIIRKFTDVYISVFKLEKKYTKEQIIEFYVNIPYLGGGAWGVEQASQVYFNKPASQLTLPEAAMIVGLFQAPDAYDPFIYPEKAETRRNQVLNLMLRHGYLTEEEYQMAKAITVDKMLVESDVYADEFQGAYDTIIEEVKTRTGLNPYNVSMKIYSTIDMERQAVINSVNDGSALKNYKFPNDALQLGIAVIDVKTGGIAAVGAGRNKKGELRYNYATMINRHPGSSAKPIFDYGPAIEYLGWGTGQMTIDDVHNYTNGGSLQNWDRKYNGIQTIKEALAQSRNVPALKTFQQLSQKQINDFVTGLGITPQYDNGYFINEAHSIGAYNGANPVQIAAAYAAFARGGIYIEPHSFTKIEFVKTGEIYTVTPEKRTVMKDTTAYLINNILRYAVTSGTIAAGSKSGTEIASKTGTSSVDDNLLKKLGLQNKNVIGDSWQAVYSPDYAFAVWVGYSDGTTKEHYLSNSTGNATRRAVSVAISNGIMLPNSKFKVPSGIVSAEIELETEPLRLASEFTPSNLRSTEYFRKGTAPEEVSTRFSKLENPSNLSVSYSNGIANLSWTGINTPDAINPITLTEYFNNGFGKQAEKYYNLRLTYNNKNIGTIGYQVYVTSDGVTKDLGWTASTTFKYSGYLSTDATFTVKAAYSIFKANQSDGISANVGEGGDEIPTWTLEPTLGTCMNLNNYNGYVATNVSFAKITENDGTSFIANDTTKTCWNASDVEVPCSSMNNNSTYTLSIAVRYNGATRTVSYQISNAC